MGGHLRLLNIACAAKAKRRMITLTKPSREAPLPFLLLGGSEKGFGIFVDSVDLGSKATEAGLKRGDQVCKLMFEMSVGTSRKRQCLAVPFLYENERGKKRSREAQEICRKVFISGTLGIFVNEIVSYREKHILKTSVECEFIENK